MGVYWMRVASLSLDQAKVPSVGAINGSVGNRARQSLATERVSRSLDGRFLAFLVHLDAFRLDPLGYLQAVFWRARGLRLRSRNRLAALMGRSPRAYPLWISRVEPKIHAELVRESGASTPVVIPVVDCTESTGPIEETLSSLGADASRAVLVGGPPVPGINRTETPAGLGSVIGSAETWLCVVRAGDRLAPKALEIYAKAAARSADSRVIYADDDLIEAGRRKAPHFKCGWNPDLFEHHNYVCGSAIIRATPDAIARLRGVNWAKALTDWAIMHGHPVHVPAVLHHRIDRPQPVVPAAVPKLPETMPEVSVIVPTRNQLALLRTCIEGVRRTAYSRLELIIIDNGSDDSETQFYLQELKKQDVNVIRIPGPFNFSSLNNAAVRHARGELLCFLNNDVEIIDPAWLSALVPQAIRADIGAVGGRLLYPDGSVQHAGVVTGVGGGAAHAHRFQRDEDPGYFMRDRLPQRVSAVTAACLVVSREKFLAVDGFNEQDFPVAFNDVDLCLKLNSRGWQSFYEPRAVLVHHESKSRGSDRSKENRQRFAAELHQLKLKWGTDRLRDPYHHPQLSPFCEQFQIAV
jgi:GT2 family glycosyltransferase